MTDHKENEMAKIPREEQVWMDMVILEGVRDVAQSMRESVAAAEAYLAQAMPEIERAVEGETSIRTSTESLELRLNDRYDRGYITGSRDMRDLVAETLTTLVTSGDLTPMAQRQISKLWEAGT